MPSAAVLLATPCDACKHTLNWHRNDVGCTVPLCVCGRFHEPDTKPEGFRHWLGRQHVSGTGTGVQPETP